MTYTTNPTNTRLTRRGWRLAQSLWLLIPIFGLGIFSFIGFIYCAVRVRDRMWTALAAGATAATIVCFIVAFVTTDESGESTSGWAGALYVLVWFTLIGLAVAFNRNYLHKLAARQATAATTYGQQSGAFGYPPPVTLTPGLSNPPTMSAPTTSSGTSPDPDASIHGLAGTDKYFAPRPPATTAPVSPQASQEEPDPTFSRAPLDINAATVNQLARSTGLDVAVCEHLVAARDRVGGFRNLDDVAAASEIQPHHLARLRSVTFGSRPDSPRSPRAGGRILDF